MEKVQPTKTTELYNGFITIDFYGPTPEKPNRHIYKVRETGKRPISVTGGTGVIAKPNLIQWAADLATVSALESDKVKGLKKEYEKIKLIKDFKLKKEAKKALDEKYPDYKIARLAHSKVKDEAAKSGSKVHNWVEQYILFKLKRIKELPDMPKEEAVRLGVMAFLKWVNEYRVKFLDTEKLVYYAVYQHIKTGVAIPISIYIKMSKKKREEYEMLFSYVGLMDWKFTMGIEKHKIVHAGDLKTSGAIYIEMRYQVSAYEEADTEESGEKYGTKWITRCDKETGEFEAHEYGDHDKDFKVFLACLTIKMREKELSKY